MDKIPSYGYSTAGSGEAGQPIESALPEAITRARDQDRLPYSVAIIVPTLNAGPAWQEALDGLTQQSLQATVLIIDSESNDGTPELAASQGFALHPIRRADFNHGGTRQMACEMIDADILIYTTQDAILNDPDAVRRLVEVFADPALGAAYGRQLPHHGAKAIEAHARLFNYPAESHRVDAQSAPRRGIKAPFLSNSFTAYRREALRAVGGFPLRVILSEDMFVGARMLQAGWQLAYVADACVRHSHSYSLRQDFQRYFDQGAFHAAEPWIRGSFGQPTGEGRRFVLSELRFLLRHAPLRIPEAAIRTVAKFIAYNLGLREAQLSLTLKRRLSMHKRYWDGFKRSASA